MAKKEVKKEVKEEIKEIKQDRKKIIIKGRTEYEVK